MKNRAMQNTKNIFLVGLILLNLTPSETCATKTSYNYTAVSSLDFLKSFIIMHGFRFYTKNILREMITYPGAEAVAYLATDFVHKINPFITKQDPESKIFIRVETLCKKLNIGMPNVYIFNNPIPRAFFAGSNTLIIYSGLIECLTEEELDTILTTELYKKISMTIPIKHAFDAAQNIENFNIGQPTTTKIKLLLILKSFYADSARKAADKFCVEKIKNRQALISALRKIDERPHAILEWPQLAIEHFWIIRAFFYKINGISHLSAQQRIAYIEQY